MNPLLKRVHNVFLTLARGQDRVCGCACGRDQTYYVVPYYNPQSMVDCAENYLLNTVWTQQQVDMIIGIVMGICIFWFLLCLDQVSHCGLRYWRANLKNSVGFWSYVAKSRHQKDSELHEKDREDSSENNLNIKQDFSNKTG